MTDVSEVTALLSIDGGVGAPPPFEQVRSQLEALIGSGRLLPGDRLPTVRALAIELGIAANTVAKAALASLAARFAGAAHDAGLTEARAVELVRAALRASTNPSH